MSITDPQFRFDEEDHAYIIRERLKRGWSDSDALGLTEKVVK